MNKLDNKGFAVSTVLYCILISFLLFLAATLEMLNSSANLISNANKDLTNGSVLKGSMVKLDNKCKASGNTLGSNEHYWTQMFNGDTLGPNRFLAKINTKYGEVSFPNDALNDSGVSALLTSDGNPIPSDGNPIVLNSSSGRFNKSDVLKWQLYSYNEANYNKNPSITSIEPGKKYLLAVYYKDVDPKTPIEEDKVETSSDIDVIYIELGDYCPAS